MTIVTDRNLRVFEGLMGDLRLEAFVECADLLEEQSRAEAAKAATPLAKQRSAVEWHKARAVVLRAAGQHIREKAGATYNKRKDAMTAASQTMADVDP